MTSMNHAKSNEITMMSSKHGSLQYNLTGRRRRHYVSDAVPLLAEKLLVIVLLLNVSQALD